MNTEQETPTPVIPPYEEWIRMVEEIRDLFPEPEMAVLKCEVEWYTGGTIAVRWAAYNAKLGYTIDCKSAEGAITELLGMKGSMRTRAEELRKQADELCKQADHLEQEGAKGVA